jgi:hypothetical protein
MAGTYADPVFTADAVSPLSRLGAEQGLAPQITHGRLASISSIHIVMSNDAHC